MLRRMLLFLATSSAIVGPCRGEVANVGPSGFAVKHVVAIQAAPENVYAVLIGKVESWWNPEHTYSHDSRNLSIDARPGGCFCEKLANGGGVEHMRVVFVSPGQVLRMAGRDDEVGRRPPLRAEKAAEQRLADASGAQDRDLAVHRTTYCRDSCVLRYSSSPPPSPSSARL